jgi:Gas vesicle protein K
VSDGPEDKLLTGPPDLEPFTRAASRLDDAVSRRIDADPENVGRGLAQLVLTIVELLRQLMERQALRRVEAGGLDDETVERLGRTLMALEQRMQELKQTFGLRDEDLNLDLGPLGRLL